MAAISGQVNSYHNVAGQPRDLNELITMISPTDTPFYSELGNGKKCTQRKHEWTTEELRAPAANAQLEGADVSSFVGSEVEGLFNIVQIFRTAINVSGTADAVEQVGVRKQYNHQMALRMKEIKKDVEYALLGNTIEVAGDAVTPRVLRGLSAWITTNFYGGAGGAKATALAPATAGTKRALTKDLIAQAIQDAYVAGGNPKLLMAAPAVRAKITSILKTVNVQNEDSTDKRTVDTIRVYESDFGVLRIVPNRVQASVTYAADTVFILDMEYWKKAFLRNFSEEKLGKTGDNTKGFIIGELTLEAKAEAASAMIADIDPTL